MSSSYLPATTDSIAHALERVEARLASLLMESKEYSEALSVLSGLIKKFDFSEQWFLFFPYLIKYKEKETSVVLSVKMVSQQQTKDSGSKKLGIVAPQDKSSKEMKSSKKMKFASTSAEDRKPDNNL
ncbi:hypothetical protein L3X38_007884 [Prunus dulcis]|uniref:Uncharacterized protein n=1 Tax=Prunus dulcis TaxID=3755 RepID=A0AAD4ZVJ4_PRUDU|nr:hypothetical protein L3X38_007884 [Prunus dulcis]